MSAVSYKHSQKALAAEIDDEFVALNVELGHCYGMRETAAAVWRMLEEPVTLNDICAHLMQVYDVPPEICRTEVQELIDHLQTGGLVQAVDPTLSP